MPKNPETVAALVTILVESRGQPVDQAILADALQAGLKARKLFGEIEFQVTGLRPTKRKIRRVHFG